MMLADNESPGNTIGIVFMREVLSAVWRTGGANNGGVSSAGPTKASGTVRQGGPNFANGHHRGDPGPMQPGNNTESGGQERPVSGHSIWRTVEGERDPGQPTANQITTSLMETMLGLIVHKKEFMVECLMADYPELGRSQAEMATNVFQRWMISQTAKMLDGE